MRILIIGGGEMVWDDIDESERLFGPDWWDVSVAVNDIGSHWPRRLDAWVSRHPKKFADWKAHRAKLGHPNGYVTYTKKGSAQKHADVAISHTYSGGASGLLAVEVALKHLGATRIVLCGVPMTSTPHFAESEVHPRGKPWHPDAHRRRWREYAGELAGLVKSMSMVYDSTQKAWVPSWTRQLLGAPTLEWLEDDGHMADAQDAGTTPRVSTTSGRSPTAQDYASHDRFGNRRYKREDDPTLDPRLKGGGVAARARNALRRNNLSLDEAVALSDAELLQLAGVGRGLVRHLRSAALKEWRASVTESVDRLEDNQND